MGEKPKRQLTPEQLERLAVARAKANEVRTKQSLVKKAQMAEEKSRKQKELEENYLKISNKQSEPQSPPKEIVNDQSVSKTKSNEPKRKVTKVIEIDSEDGSSSSSSDNDSDYDITPVREKYKQKYKSKYAMKYQAPQQTTPYQDAYTIARHNLHTKVNQEVKRLALSSLFG